MWGMIQVQEKVKIHVFFESYHRRSQRLALGITRGTHIKMDDDFKPKAQGLSKS